MADLHVVILAAGKGTRMKSARPKVLHALAGRPLIEHVLRTVDGLRAATTTVVVGHGADAVHGGARAPAGAAVRRPVTAARHGPRPAPDGAGPARTGMAPCCCSTRTCRCCKAARWRGSRGAPGAPGRRHRADRRARRSVRLRPHRARRRRARSRASSKSATRRPRNATLREVNSGHLRLRAAAAVRRRCTAWRPTTRRASTT